MRTGPVDRWASTSTGPARPRPGPTPSGVREASGMTSSARPGPLDGIQVIDLTTARSGPTCVRQLVDLGAQAIRIAAPGRGDLPGSDGWNLHRAKRSMLVDLATESGRDILLRLVARADVLVENFRPAVKHRLRIAPDDLFAANPRLVYGSISGFGQDGPYADRPGVDQIAQGLSGLMSVTGPPGTGPWRAGIAVSDSTAGTFLAQGIIAALFARERTGHGQWVHTSLLESMVNLMDFQAARVVNEGDVPRQAGNDHPTLFPMGTYPTADGYVNVAGMLGFDRFCEVLGHPEWATDERFAAVGARVAHRDELTRLVDEVLTTRSTAEWVRLLNDAGIPAGPVCSLDETFADPQIRHLALAAPTPPDEGRRPAVVLRHPVTFTDTPAAVRGGVPSPGQDTVPVLAELGLDADEIERLLGAGVVAERLGADARVI